MRHQIFIGLGSNLGDRGKNIVMALELLDRHPRIQLIQTSRLHETEPVGVKTDHWFLNAVAEIRTDLGPRELLDELSAIEKALGRDRSRGPDRTIDLDILAYNGLVIEEDGLSIPHPRLQERRFVLAPWAEIAPDFLVPCKRSQPGTGTGRTVRALFEDLPAHGQADRPFGETSEE
ncbi:MAG: 2-amino-4-hydroxy-6-hydroxymethyldihydropteridine diphosphokinase [Deltaproteobacteria bacterium]